MTQQPKDWLPADSFTLDTVRLAVADVIAAWSNRWFVNVQAQIAAVRPFNEKLRVAHGLRVQGTASGAELSGRGKRALLEAALNIDLSGLALTGADHEVLDAFARELIKDLLSSLDNLGNEDRDDGRLSITVSLAGAEIADVTLSIQTLVPAIKNAWGKTQRQSHAPKPYVEALRPVKLVVEGVLGRAELTFDDLKGLAVGDVVILDSDLKGHVDLRLHGTGQRIAGGKLGRADNRVSIQL